MENTIGRMVCVSQQSNTGLPTCKFDPKNIEGCVLLPTGTTYSATQQLTLPTVLAAAIINDNIALRIFPIKKFVEMEDKTEENQIQTMAFGGMLKGRQGKYAWYFSYVNGGMALHKAIYTFDQMQDAYDVMFIDGKNNVLWGVQKGTLGNDLGGFNIELIDVKNIKLNDGSNTTKYGVGFCLEDPDEVNVLAIGYQFAPTNKILTTLNGLKNLEISVHTEMAAGLIKLKFTTGDKATNLYDSLSAALATASLFTVTTDTGATVTVTSATAVAATKTINLLVDVLDADYIAAGATGILTINYGPVSAMIAALIVGYGNSSIDVVRGA